MSHRLPLLVGALVTLAATAPVHAQEAQLTITGLAYPVAGNGGGSGVPFAVSFDFNPLSGQQQATFQQFGGTNFLQSYSDTGFQVTNFFASIGGQTISAPRSSTGVVGLLLESTPGGRYEFGFNASVFSFESGAGLGNFTQSQYLAFKDPLESMLPSLLTYHGSESGGLPGYDLAPLSTTFRVVGVPEPGVLALLLTGLVGLGLARSKRQVPATVTRSV
jgi:hypothetical protein